MKVQITKKHIAAARSDLKHGVTTRARCCPIAQAIKQLFPDTKVVVGLDVVYIGQQMLLLTKRAQAFIRNFDRGGNTAPATFNLKEY